MQNARDSQKECVHIQILFDETQRTVSFSHDGKSFDRLSLLRLITQISDKIEGQDNTGRFGTGFIATNLLSKTIHIQGAYQKEDGNYTNLDFVLDRSAWIIDKKTCEYVHPLKMQIQAAIQDMDKLERSPTTSFSNKLTTFSYPLEENDALMGVKIGLTDLEKQLPLVMAFNPAICSVSVNGEEYLCNNAGLNEGNGTIYISRYHITKNRMPFRSVLVFTNTQTRSQIAFYINDKQLESYPEQTPRLFCRFPMVGTECFGLPFVLNSEAFEVTETRDALREDHPQNLQLLDVSLQIYQFALNYFIQQGYLGYQHICMMDKNPFPSMSKQYADRAKQIYSDKPIVKSCRGEMQSLKNVRIPVIKLEEFPKDMPRENKSELSVLLHTLVSACPHIEIPVYPECADWFHVYSESKITVEELGVMIKDKNFLSAVQQPWLNWLNDYIRLLALLGKKEYLRDSTIYVNQTYVITIQSGNYIDHIENEKLKDIFDLIFYPEKENSIRKRLLLKELDLSHPIFKELISYKDDKIVALEIAQKVAEQQALAKKNGTLNPSIQQAFYELFYWMNSNEALSAVLFPATYKDRMSLCSSEEQIEHYKFGIQTKQALAKYEASSVDELVEKLENKYAPYTDAYLSTIQNETASILTNKPEEVDESTIIQLLQQNAIQNEKELVWLMRASFYSPEAIQSFLQYRRSSLEKAYQIVEKLLSEAARRIFHHLGTKRDIYNLSAAEKIAPTVYDGILKNGEEICIIARPSNNKKVILYYDSEPDYLRKNYELWIVDTNNPWDTPRILTFGDMIKITGIRVIPLRNLFV